MKNYKFKEEDIWKHTDGGFDVIKRYYNDAHKKKHFKIHDEKTASTALKKKGDVWILTNYGDGSKSRNAIQIVKEEEGITHFEAMKYIDANFCNGTLNNSPTSYGAIFEDSKNATGKTILNFNEKITDKELSFIGANVTQEIAKRYNLRSIKYYITKGNEENGPKKITATQDYPILCFDQGEWQKIYQPKGKKAFRFFHTGTRPKNFIFGLEQLKQDVEELKKDAKTKIIKESEGEEIPEEGIDERIKEEIEKDMPDVIIASGERDALNIATAGHAVIWQNSETAVLEYDVYKEIKELAKNIYNVPDLDATGIRQGYALALKYIDIKTIWLPEKLRLKKDWRGNPCKDATDFFDKYTRADKLFGKMKAVAFSLKFWMHSKKNGYTLNNLAFYEFLHANGYYRIEDKNNKFGYVYIKLKGNVIEKIDPDTKGSIKNNVRDFVNAFMENKFLPVGLRNMFYKTRQTDENSMSNLKYYDALDFKTYGKDFQYMFFKNKAWKITKEGIEEETVKNIKKHVWETDINTKCAYVKKDKQPMFEINHTEAYKNSSDKNSFPYIDKFEIKFNEPDHKKRFIFLQYLTNASRIFWQKGSDISETEIKEQRLHLINKLYSLGYLAHRYKNPSRTWAVFAIDGRESEAGKSFGGSGKSILYGSLEHINKQFYIGGRSPQKLKNDFLFDGIDEFTDNVLVDDANQYLDFGFFYPAITGKLNINPKNAKPFTLDYQDSPKFAFTSNFGIRNADPSTERRILYTVFSDYYHKKDLDGEYKENMDPLKEFGKNLFNDFDEEEWNMFYNLVALSIQTYLKFEKIEPPMKNVITRNLRSAIGEDVLAWANDYFSNAEYLNREFNKEDAYKNCTDKYIPKSKLNFFSIRKFKTAVKLYCQYRDWIFNPEEACNDNQGRIMRDVSGKNSEFFYVQTDANKEIEITHDIKEDADIHNLKETDDIPF